MCTYVRKTRKGDVEVTSGLDCPPSLNVEACLIVTEGKYSGALCGIMHMGVIRLGNSHQLSSSMWKDAPVTCFDTGTINTFLLSSGGEAAASLSK